MTQFQWICNILIDSWLPSTISIILSNIVHNLNYCKEKKSFIFCVRKTRKKLRLWEKVPSTNSVLFCKWRQILKSFLPYMSSQRIFCGTFVKFTFWFKMLKNQNIFLERDHGIKQRFCDLDSTANCCTRAPYCTSEALLVIDLLQYHHYWSWRISGGQEKIFLHFHFLLNAS